MTFYVEGISGSATFRDTELKATYSEEADVTDKANVTVFELTLTGIFAGAQQGDNDVRFSTYLVSSDMNGKISWDDANGDGIVGDMDTNCQYFHNCMELRGNVKPSGVQEQAGFAFLQDAWAVGWAWVGGTPGDPTLDIQPWAADNPEAGAMDLTPSVEDNIFLNYIYTADGPGWTGRTRPPDHVAGFGDFRDRVVVSIGGTSYQCSDWYRWHSQFYLKPKNDTQLTRDEPGLQVLGSGWMNIPAHP